MATAVLDYILGSSSLRDLQNLDVGTDMSKRTKILQIYHDTDSSSPREWDNLGTMACWHDRYNLGDIQPDGNPEQFITSLTDDYDSSFIDGIDAYFDELHDKGTPREEVVAMVRQHREKHFNKHYFSLGLHLYDHGQITISTSRFNCPWDSGQVGFIFVPRTVAEKELNPDGKSFPQIRNTPMGGREFESLEDLVHFYLRSEVEVYDQYLRGETYGFVLLDANGEEEDACWGFIGSNWRTNGIADNVDLSEVKEVHHMESRTHTILQAVEVEVLT